MNKLSHTGVKARHRSDAAAAAPDEREAALEAVWAAILVTQPNTDHRRTAVFTLRRKDAVDRTVAHHAHVLSPTEADHLVKRGIPSKALDALGGYLGVGKGEVAEFLNLDRTTALRRTAKDQPLPTHAAEAMLRLLEIEQMAADTFETLDDSKQWLSTPHDMLDSETPLQCAKTSYGAQRVRDILVALKYGGVV